MKRDATRPPDEVRPARVEERPTPEVLAAVDAACFDQPWGVQAYADLLANPVIHAWVLRADDLPAAPMGLVCWQQVADEAELLQIAIVPRQRRGGWGRWLLRRWLTHVGACGARRAFLEVREGNRAARALYVGEGFQETGRRPGYYAHPSEDAVLYARAWGDGD